MYGNGSYYFNQRINDRILVDANTLTILSEVDSLALLDCFDEVLIPYNTITRLKQRGSGLVRSASDSIFDFIKKSINIKEISVEVGLKIQGRASELLPEDTLDCIALSEEHRIPYLNTEVSIYKEFKPNYAIDFNTFFFYLKKEKPDKREMVANTIKKLRSFNAEFISFDADDIYINYKSDGFEGVKSFMRMGKNADYNTFISAYISFLEKIKQEIENEEFELLAKEFINFFDGYIGKSRYHMSSIIRRYPSVEVEFMELIKKCSIVDILNMNKKIWTRAIIVLTYLEIIGSYNLNRVLDKKDRAFLKISDSVEFMKIRQIAMVCARFMIQFLVTFGKTDEEFNYYIDFIKTHIRINKGEDIDYIVELFKSAKSKEETA